MSVTVIQREERPINDFEKSANEDYENKHVLAKVMKNAKEKRSSETESDGTEISKGLQNITRTI